MFQLLLSFAAFKCCYCGFFNPARKQRPNAPRLEQPTPSLSRQQSTSDGKCDDGGESDKEGSNSGNDNTGKNFILFFGTILRKNLWLSKI